MEDQKKEDENNPEKDEQMKNDSEKGLFDLGEVLGVGSQMVVGSDNPGDDFEYNKQRMDEKFANDASNNKNNKKEE